ncbi:Na+/H+ antiporter NhaA [Rothia sp. P100]|uniref:Na+/H+ antiporter NhaA n=1 Tax=Rothia sp. P100 TaxID=2939578 RepID=UPI0020416777|nr:Na+/H+ antiporter NhaA [Rothia sp. P100]MCM3510807.1 Na+/H+ antiporter NhaA [Rothia sp. P100]
MSQTPQSQDLFSRGSYAETARISDIMRKESVGGFILLAATVLAVVLANTQASHFYETVRDTEVGITVPGFSHLMMNVHNWAADGLLTVFFFLTGLELKKEFVVGDLRSPGKAIVPVAAAFGGAMTPAILYFAINNGSDTAVHGWAIPAATDIAFAVAVLAGAGTFLPAALRTFLLTLAVVDDLIAIVIIALFYTSSFQAWYLIASIIPIGIYFWMTHKHERLFHEKKWAAWVILLPLGLITWALFLESGIHATIAGVILGFCVPVRMTTQAKAAGSHGGLSEVLEHRLRPLSTGLCVPLFAFFSAGVAIGGWDGLQRAVTDPVAIGIIVGLVVGKTIGITGTTWLITRFRGVNLDSDIAWVDIIGLAVTGGIGFTVSMLVAELSFAAGDAHTEDAKIGIMIGSVTAAICGAIILSIRNKHYKLIAQKESLDENQDGIPDVFTDDTSKR